MSTTRVGRLLATAVIAVVVGSPVGAGSNPAATLVVRGAAKEFVPFSEVKPVLETVRPDLLPVELKSKPIAELEAGWPAWVVDRDRSIRERLFVGDEDSLFNFLLFGVTFTKRPRATERDVARFGGGQSGADVIQGRVKDLVAAVANPASGNERLRFASQVIERRGIDLQTDRGKNEAVHYLVQGLIRMFAKYEANFSGLNSSGDADDRSTALSTIFRDRGLSSDTSIFTSFALDQALTALKSSETAALRRVRRVAIVGPGLDFTDKREGYDFYPVQTIQPFAVVDSLIRLGLATLSDIEVTILDVNPRIEHHLDDARQRARAGAGYVLQLPRDADQGWNPDLEAYWSRVGARIGADTAAAAVPPNVGPVDVRAVRIDPKAVLTIVPTDLNIVLERLVLDRERFDLVIATNVFVYYGAFEQALALTNIAKMLDSKGLFLVNSAVVALPSTPFDLIGATPVVYSNRPDSNDRLFWFRRQ